MSRTRLQLVSAVQDILGRIDKDDVILLGLDIALEDIKDRHVWNDLALQDTSIIEDDGSVTLPTNFDKLIEARLIDGTSSYPITIRSSEFVRTNYPNPSEDSTGTPYLGFVEGGSLYFIPYSNDSYSIYMTYN